MRLFVLVFLFLFPFVSRSQTYCHLILHFEKNAEDMTHFVVVSSPFYSDTLKVNYEKLKITEEGLYEWNDHFKVSKKRVRRAFLTVQIYFLNPYKLAIDKAEVTIPKKDLIMGSHDDEPPGIFVK